MGIYLGNLTIKEFEKRAGIELTDEERALFEEMREQVCGIVLDILTPYSSKIKEPLQVGGGVK